MPAVFTRYANDIVSLTVLALMVLALVAGEAGAGGSTLIHSANADGAAATEQLIAVGHDKSRRNEGA